MKSMTGFGRGESRQTDGTTWVVECSSVNRKQLEVSVNLPRDLSDLETQVRSQVAGLCSRGRVNVHIRSDAAEVVKQPRVDEVVAAQYVQTLKDLAGKLGISPEISLGEIARLPGVLVGESAEADAEAAWPAIHEALTAALEQLCAMRGTEGDHLKDEMKTRLGCIEAHASAIAEKAPNVPEHQRQVLRQRLEQAGLPLPLDDERLLKEIALFADRTDISEELSRAASHLNQFRTYLASPEPVGRSLDFLVQEFFREFNTMGSKCNNAEIAHAVVSAKTELEKIREQVQNVE
ncbi:MAG: YicC family protein [Prosthecobacter sp.]|nr:YicC family protein [Prosthecobacter sp.]